MICDICGHKYVRSCVHCTRRVMTWGVEGSLALYKMALRKDDIPSQELGEFIDKYYVGQTRPRSAKANVLRIALRLLGYKGHFVGRIHVNQTDYNSIRQRELSTGLRWRLRNDTCDKCGSSNDLRLHHLVPIAWGGLTSKENCVTLCKECHKEAHRELAKLLNRNLLLEYLEPHKEEIYKKAMSSIK